MKESFLKVAAASNGLAFMELTAPFSPCVGLWTEKFDGPACEEERMVGLHVCGDPDGDTQGRQASRSHGVRERHPVAGHVVAAVERGDRLDGMRLARQAAARERRSGRCCQPIQAVQSPTGLTDLSSCNSSMFCFILEIFV